MRNLYAILSILIILSILTGCKQNNTSDEDSSGHSSSEAICEHTWDDGEEIEGGSGAYLMEYTCTDCGEKYQELIMIIPPIQDTTEAVDGLYRDTENAIFCIICGDTITVSKKNNADAITASSIVSYVFNFNLDSGSYIGENKVNTVSFKLNDDKLDLILDGKAYYLFLDENASFNEETVEISKPVNVNVDASQIFWNWHMAEFDDPYVNGILSAYLTITSKGNELIKDKHINFIPEPASMFSYDLKNMKLAPGEYFLSIQYTGGSYLKNGTIYQSFDSDAVIFSVTVTEDNNYIISPDS